MVTNIYPTAEAIEKLRGHGHIVTQHTPIAVRMVKMYCLMEKPKYCSATIMIRKIFCKKKLGELYFIRWKIETAYTKQKKLFTDGNIQWTQGNLYRTGLLGRAICCQSIEHH